jgi:predicted flap endonuclease-1-like 5' DNA nuclease
MEDRSLAVMALSLSRVFQARQGGLPWWLWLVIVLVLFLVIWWWLLRRPAGAPEEEHHATAAPAPEPAPAPTAADDLTRLEGIGPKVAAVLAAAGIQTFAQLAETPVERLQHILREAGLQFLDPASWPEQARVAASGDEARLAALQARLRGGRYA